MFVAAVLIVGGLLICNCLIVLLNNGLYTCTRTSPPTPTADNEPRLFRFRLQPDLSWLRTSNRCSSVSYTKHPSTWLAWDILDPMHLTASYWLPPWCLLALRFCLLLHFALTILLTSLTDGDITPTWLLAFGSWSSIMVGCTGLLGCIISLKDMTTHLCQSASPRAVLGGSSQLKRHPSGAPCQIIISVLAHGWANDAVTTDMASEWSILDKLYVLALSTAAPAAVMIPVLYWPKSSVPTTDCVLQVTAIALLLAEVMLSRAPLVTYHLQVFLLFCSAYMGTLWGHQAVTGVWLYSRLDWSRASSITMYIGLMFLVVLSWFAWYCIACFRETVGGVMLQDKATATFIAGINPVFELPIANAAAREPSFALWTQNADQVHITAVSRDANTQLPESPTKRIRHTQSTVCV